VPRGRRYYHILQSKAFFSLLLILSIVSSFIHEKMSYQIIIKPSNHTFTVEPGETILAAALRQGFSLPYGCRNGSCGACKGKIIQGIVNYGRYNQETLTDTEKQHGLALFCCAQPLSDLIIESREVDAIK